ncbi:MAG TPA: outer membrane protein [Xanthobacteraceae bacterium]|nr:outer membrane protein [Xanthobacteraceae bacterium]
MRIATALLLASTTLFTVGSQAAYSADLPYKAARPAPIAAPVWNWNGLYIGAHVGAGWGTIESEFSAVGFPIASASVNGFLGGGQIGYNIQNGIVVFGVEADASWSNITGTTPCFVAASCQRDIDFLGTITGRVGVTADRALIYVKGGAAWAHVEHEFNALGIAQTSADKTVWGWTVGTGVEYAITGNWSAKIEYNFMDFGKNTLSFAGPIPGGAVDVETTSYVHAVKFGVNYRFGGDAIVARY